MGFWCWGYWFIVNTFASSRLIGFAPDICQGASLRDLVKMKKKSKGLEEFEKIIKFVDKLELKHPEVKQAIVKGTLELF